MRSTSPVRTPKLQLAPEQPSTGKCWIPPKKMPRIQEQRRSPRKMVGGEKSCLQSNPIPTRDTQRAQTKPWAHQDTETEPDQPLKCLNVSCRGKGQQWPAAGRGALAAADLGHAACGMSPLGGGLH